MAMMAFMRIRRNAGATSAHYASTTIAKLTMFATLCISFRTRALSLRLQIAQSRYYLQTLDTKVGTICILGALGFLHKFFSYTWQLLGVSGNPKPSS